MFTGIITHTGTITKKGQGRLHVSSEKSLLKQLSNGASISINGICLTVIELNESSFTIDFIPETEKRTTIRVLKENDLVNLELPATGDSFLSGHIVQGHVDGVGEILEITKDGNSYLFKFSVPKSLTKYMVEKGSISVNGIALTIIEIADEYFTVGIIPHTWEITQLHTAKVGDEVNLEVDVLAKYIEKLLSKK